MANINYNDILNLRHLSIQSLEMATKVRLIVSGSFSGEEPALVITRVDPDPGTIYTVPYAPWPIVEEYSHPTGRGSVYKRYKIPDGFNPFYKATDVPMGTNPTGIEETLTNANGSPTNEHRDGDPDTYITASTAGSLTIRYDQDCPYEDAQIWGFEFMGLIQIPDNDVPAFVSPGGWQQYISMRYTRVGTSPAHTVDTTAYWPITPSDDDIISFKAVFLSLIHI